MSNISGALYKVNIITTNNNSQCHASVSSKSHVFKWLR